MDNKIINYNEKKVIVARQIMILELDSIPENVQNGRRCTQKILIEYEIIQSCLTGWQSLYATIMLNLAMLYLQGYATNRRRY